MSDLATLIAAVETADSAVATPQPTWSTEDWGHWHKEGGRIAEELRINHGARIHLDREPQIMTLGGVRSSATGGWQALLRNWRTAARRRLRDQEAEQ